MIIGFTGTSTGMTQKQIATVRYLFTELQVTELHHGECCGADGQANRIAIELGIRRVGHPPTDKRKWVYCRTDESWPEKPYLKRNRDIIGATEGLIACPKDFIAPVSNRGQGTWTTVGYARQAGRTVWLVLPDGTFTTDARPLDHHERV